MRKSLVIGLIVFILPIRVSYSQEYPNSKVPQAKIKDAIDERVEATRNLFCIRNECRPAFERYAFDPDQYRKGFNEGMQSVLLGDRIDGTDTRLKRSLEAIRNASCDYRNGYFAALEVHAAVSNLLYEQNRLKDNQARDSGAAK